MDIKQKGQLIATIMRTLKAVARLQDKPFDESDTFFALAFKTDNELEKITTLIFK